MEKQYNYLIESSDFFSLNKRIKEIINKDKFDDAVFSSYDVEEDQMASALEDLDTYGFFTNKKVVVIYNIDCFNIDVNKDLYEHLIRYIDHSNHDYMLILTSKKLNNTKKITKDLKMRLQYILVDIHPEDYIKEKLKEYKLIGRVVKIIAEECVDDIARIDNECNKLMNYKADTKEIFEKDVFDLLVKKQKDAMSLTFDFVRSLASKDKSASLRKYRELVDNQVEPISLLGLLASQIRIIYQVKVLNRQGFSSKQIADRLTEKPYRISKTLELIRYYNEKELLQLMKEISAMDLKMKTTDVDSKFLIELFILNHC